MCRAQQSFWPVVLEQGGNPGPRYCKQEIELWVMPPALSQNRFGSIQPAEGSNRVARFQKWSNTTAFTEGTIESMKRHILVTAPPAAGYLPAVEAQG